MNFCDYDIRRAAARVGARIEHDTPEHANIFLGPYRISVLWGPGHGRGNFDPSDDTFIGRTAEVGVFEDHDLVIDVVQVCPWGRFEELLDHYRDVSELPPGFDHLISDQAHLEGDE